MTGVRPKPTRQHHRDHHSRTLRGTTPVITGAGKHTFPSRTRPLRPQPPMVVQPRCCARVGCRRVYQPLSFIAKRLTFFPGISPPHTKAPSLPRGRSFPASPLKPGSPDGRIVGAPSLPRIFAVQVHYLSNPSSIIFPFTLPSGPIIPVRPPCLPPLPFRAIESAFARRFDEGLTTPFAGNIPAGFTAAGPFFVGIKQIRFGRPGGRMICILF